MERELEAMESAFEALTPLAAEERQRAILWLSQKLAVPLLLRPDAGELTYFIIGSSSRLLKEDTGEDLAQMRATLAVLKAQKDHIASRIRAKEKESCGNVRQGGDNDG